MQLVVSNLRVVFDRIAAVRDVSLEIDAGETVCITGPNGAGKSSTLLAIAGAIRPSGGSICLNGKEISGSSPEDTAVNGISLVPEGRHIFSRLTVRENLVLGSSARKNRESVARDLEEICTYFPILTKRQSAIAGTLSGGEQQMLTIGRALMSRPNILMLDEPSLGLAPKIIDQVYEIIERLKALRISFLIVEESLHRALDFADRIYIFSSGRIRAAGTSASLASNPTLLSSYFGDVV